MNDFQPPVLFRLSAGFSGKDTAFKIGFLTVALAASITAQLNISGAFSMKFNLPR